MREPIDIKQVEEGKKKAFIKQNKERSCRINGTRSD